VRQLVQPAYDFTYERFRILGGPSWIDDERYDVRAAPVAQSRDRIATPQEIAVRVQALLADRFKLVLRRETREMQLYDLRLARPGALRANTDTCTPRTQEPKAADDARPYCGLSFLPDSSGLEHLVGTGVRIPVLARRLQQLVEAIVVDRTDLVAAYDFTLDYVRPRNFADRLEVTDGVSILHRSAGAAGAATDTPARAGRSDGDWQRRMTEGELKARQRNGSVAARGRPRRACIHDE
jgi:uncharacterized protein (TIGR03435 family)